MCRFAPIAPSSGYLTTLWCLAGGFSRRVLRSAQSQTWLPPRAALLHRHPESLQLSIHHLPVRGVHCQLGCPDVWQKRHALTPIIPPGAWRVAQLGCIPAPVLARDAAVLTPPRPPPAYHPPLSPIRPAAPQTIPPAARSARISAAGSPAPPRAHT